MGWLMAFEQQRGLQQSSTDSECTARMALSGPIEAQAAIRQRDVLQLAWGCRMLRGCRVDVLRSSQCSAHLAMTSDVPLSQTRPALQPSPDETISGSRGPFFVLATTTAALHTPYKNTRVNAQ